MEDESLHMMKRTRRSSRRIFWWAVLATIVCVALIIALAVVSNKNKAAEKTVAVPNIKWCTVSSEEQSKCMEMSNAFKDAALQPGVDCIQKDDTTTCFQALKSNEAEVFTTDGGDIFENVQSVKPVMAEDYGFGDASYWAVAVVRKSDNTTFLTEGGFRGKRSCHTGYQRSSGWKMPMGVLSKLNIVTGCGDALETGATHLFGTMCVPKAECQFCTGCSGTCTDKCVDINHTGYTGAFRCLVENGDVAFVKHTTVFINTDGNNDDEWARNLLSSDYELLCQDGKRASLANYESCNLGKVPSHAVVVSKDSTSTTVSRIVQLLLIAQLKFGPDSDGDFKLFGGSKNLLFKSSTQRLLPLRESCSAEQFLGSDYLNNQNRLTCKTVVDVTPGPSCIPSQYSAPDSRVLRWCVVSTDELKKCSEIASNAAYVGSPLDIACVLGEDEAACGRMVGQGAADLANLDGGHIYDAGVNYDVVPVAAEYYGSVTSSGNAASYYAVAVIRSSDSSTMLTKSGLQGKRTCHTGFGKTSGWKVPVGYLASQGIFTPGQPACDFPNQVSNFFGGSCVPGIDKDKYAKLCRICKGTGTNNCSAGNEPYRGYDGALQCLAEDAGDIAFINHLTVIKANQSQYRLLCKNGSTAPPSAYQDCNLAQVPSHALVTSSSHSSLYREKIWGFLNQIQKISNFTVFSNGGKDLLFKGSTQCLWKVQSGCNWKDYLGQDYHASVKYLNCEGDGKPITTKPCSFVQAC